MVSANITSVLESVVSTNKSSIESVVDITKELNISTPWYVFLVILNLLVVILGVSGNILVLYTAIRHKAIKVDRVSLFLIEILSATDIAIVIIYFFPMLTTLLGKRWFLGTVACYIQAMTSEIPFYYQIMIKTTISVYRLWVCRQVAPVDNKASLLWLKLLMIGSFVLSFAPMALSIGFKCTAEFIPQILRCLSSQYIKLDGNEDVQKYSSVMIVLFIAIPTIIILFANTTIWVTIQSSHRKVSKHSTRNHGNKQPKISPAMKKTVLMLTLICCTFVLCYIPTLVKFVFYTRGYKIAQWFYLFHNYMLSLNSIVNPFIYLATNAKFRNHIRNMFLCKKQ